MIDGDHVESMPADWLSAEPHREPPEPATSSALTFNLDDVEKQTILRCLEDSGYNIAKSAEALGITRPTLYAKMRKYGLQLTSRVVQGARARLRTY
jgi:DNA-binding NtrC family response regulator